MSGQYAGPRLGSDQLLSRFRVDFRAPQVEAIRSGFVDAIHPAPGPQSIEGHEKLVVRAHMLHELNF